MFIHSRTSILKRQLECTPENVVKDSADDGVVKRIIKRSSTTSVSAFAVDTGFCPDPLPKNEAIFDLRDGALIG
jgi:hypothetical protein